MTNIEWTDLTLNLATGCTRISPGCDRCYMFALYPRLKGMGSIGYSKSPDEVTLLPERLDQIDKWRKPRRVFVNSMSDFFHPDIPAEFRVKAFEKFEAAPHHTFQVLTKRPETAAHWWKRTMEKLTREGEGWPCNYTAKIDWCDRHRLNPCVKWPTNIWLGTSVESNDYRGRIARLAETGAPIKFVSAEPLLGPLDLSSFMAHDMIQWVIVGGESGPGARPMDEAWVRDLRDQCQHFGVAFFLKQMTKKATIPSDLLIREFPDGITKYRVS